MEAPVKFMPKTDDTAGIRSNQAVISKAFTVEIEAISRTVSSSKEDSTPATAPFIAKRLFS